MPRLLILLTALLLPTFAFAADDETRITIYSKAQPGSVNPDMYRPTAGGRSYGYQSIPGYGIIKHTRRVSLDDSVSELKFSDVAALIDPTTVAFSSKTDPKGTSVLEQNYLFDLVSREKLLGRYLGQDISVEQTIGDSIETINGTLLSNIGGITLKKPDGKVVTLNGYKNINFPELPGGLITKPTLFWKVATNKPGKHTIDVAYETKGITWWADYNLTFTPDDNPNKGTIDLGAWVSIINQSGATYNDAKLKLVAGDVNRATPPQDYKMARAEMAMDTMGSSTSSGGFQEKSFFEYHLYTLGRSTSLPENSTKQIELFPTATNVKVDKKLVYYGSTSPYHGYTQNSRNYGNIGSKKVDVYLEFKNKKELGLGVPLPAGRIRVSQLDTADGSLEFIGEDIIDHTPKDEDILIKLGSAFDVVGERRQVDFKTDNNRNWMQETIEVKIRNRKEEAVDVVVVETLGRAKNWKITSKSTDYEKKNAYTVHFPITVDPDEEEIVRFTVEYTW